ncbi:hypothetical protein PM082_000543 [Marasmius tenuissimus]|nr:hypothetical protein PM082_000543 [Marasmius tenuissimus]
MATDQDGNEIQLDVRFIDKAIFRFKSAKAALIHLRKLGKPPTSQFVGLYNLSPPIEGALEVVGALAGFANGLEGLTTSRLTTFHLKKEWASSNMALWIDFLLHHFVLADDSEPSTPEALDALEHMLTLIPCMLSFPSKDPVRKADIAAIQKLSPTLHPVFVHTWCKVLEKQHHTWGDWSLLLRDFAEHDLTIRILDSSPLRRLYPPDEVTGYAILRHLHFLAPRIHKVEPRELRHARFFVEAISFCHQGSAMPIESPTIRPSALFAMSALMVQLVTKRKDLSNAATDSKECQVSHAIACQAALLVAMLLREPAWVEEVIKAGMLKAVVKAYPCLFEYDRRPEVMKHPEKQLELWMGRILEQIARFLFYSSVFHLYSRAFRKISRTEGEGWNEMLQAKSEPLYKRWAMARYRAFMITEIRSFMKARAARFLCNNDVCPRINLASEEQGKTDTRFFLCNACTTVMYCSHKCQKVHWKANHRAECPSRTRFLATAPALTEFEFRVMHAFVDAYLKMHSGEITTMIDSFIESLKSTEVKARLASKDVQCIVKGTKPPIIFCDFSSPSLPDPKLCVNIYDPVTFAHNSDLSQRGAAERIPDWIELWRTKVDEGHALIISAFARKKDLDAVIDRFSSFPLLQWNPVFEDEEDVLD